MPMIYVSPSIQEYNKFVIGGDEEYYMNLIADAMVPYLSASNIDFSRNSPGDSMTDVINKSNAKENLLHIALHSNSAPENLSGILRGPDVYYYAYSENGEKVADILAKNIKNIYQNPDLVTVIPNTTLPELSKVKAPAVLLETGYHDNIEDAEWIKNNINGIAKAIVTSITEYLEIPFIDPYSTSYY